MCKYSEVVQDQCLLTKMLYCYHKLHLLLRNIDEIGYLYDERYYVDMHTLRNCMPRSIEEFIAYIQICFPVACLCGLGD